MTKQGRTKDELFIICLHEQALKLPEIDDPIDRYKIGTLVGLQAIATDTICQLLTQANFIKKHGKAEISITAHGIKLVERLTDKP
ncbi:MAG: hypothetical protein LLF94_10635 [Chlamydiales bacterium]|nr:hypothetical protein [Chlamydiales bacterium]